MITRREELLSAFADEEVSELEAQRLCKELLSDDREVARWARYHLIRDAMRGNLPPVVDVNFAANVMAKVRQDSLDIQPRRGDWRDRWLKSAAGFGLAASIAVVAVVGYQSLTVSSPVVNVAQVTPTPLASPRSARESGSEISSRETRLPRNPEVAARLNSYLVNHSEYAPSHGVMPYARVVVGYDVNQH